MKNKFILAVMFLLTAKLSAVQDPKPKINNLTIVAPKTPVQFIAAAEFARTHKSGGGSYDA